MVLTGDGGDEVLSGYPSFQVEKFVNHYQRLPALVRHSAPSALRFLNNITPDKVSYGLNRYERLLRTSSYSFEERLLAKVAWLEQERRGPLLKNYNVFPVRDFLDDFMKDCPFSDTFYKLQYFHLRLSLPEDMLTKVDRMSMAHSLEARVPFLDHRLVEYMSGVHKDVKLQGTTRKSVLRNTLGKKLPKALLKAPKSGFSVPLREWFKDDGFTRRLDDLANTDWKLDRIQLDQIISDNRTGKRDYGNLIWMLFLLRKAI
jgi:asparagine synthase (glutamine-hydrolysing)